MYPKVSRYTGSEPLVKIFCPLKGFPMGYLFLSITYLSSLVPSWIVGSTVQKIPPGKHLAPKSKSATGVLEEAMSSSFGGTPCIIQITCYTECEQTVCVCVGGGVMKKAGMGEQEELAISKPLGTAVLILPLLLSCWFTNRNLLDIGFPKCHRLCVSVLLFQEQDHINK